MSQRSRPMSASRGSLEGSDIFATRKKNVRYSQGSQNSRPQSFHTTDHRAGTKVNRGSDEYLQRSLKPPRSKDRLSDTRVDKDDLRYSEAFENLKGKDETLESKISNDRSSDLMVTHINQVHGLFTQDGVNEACSKVDRSSSWLQDHSIEKYQLTLKHLFSRGKILSPQQNETTGKLQQRIEFSAADMTEFEFKLNGSCKMVKPLKREPPYEILHTDCDNCVNLNKVLFSIALRLIQLYSNRVKWLLQGCRKMFGCIKGNHVSLLVDCSDVNLEHRRLTELKQDLLHLIDEQLSQKKMIYPVAFGSEVNPMYTKPKETNQLFIEEMKDWVHMLKPQGGTNLLEALCNVYSMKDTKTIVIVLGSVPDQDANVLCDYIDQISLARDVTIHGVLYNCNSKYAENALRRLAESSGGVFHCYSAFCQEDVYQSTDISAILSEIDQCKEIIAKIKEMREGHLGSAAVSVNDEISIIRSLPRPPGHENPLNINKPTGDLMSSADWLAQHGLKAKKLDLYQILAPNAFSLLEEFVPVIKRTVQAQVHGRSMTQVEWHDGSVKNVHVDVAQLYEYQKRLGGAVRLYEQRIDWVGGASRKHASAVSEKIVVVLVDLCAANASHIVLIQQMMRSLLEQQMSNVAYLNIIGMNEKVLSWKPTVIKPSEELLQEAWRWILGLECSGTRNLMGGLRTALENDSEISHKIEVEGLYLFTTGIPDQSQDLIYSYLEQVSAGRSLKLHVTYFNIDHDLVSQDKQKSSDGGRYATAGKTVDVLKSLSHSSGGRFHSISQNSYESDDVKLLAGEIEKALNYSRKCSMLVDSVKKKCNLELTADLPNQCHDERSDDEHNDDEDNVDECAVVVKPVLPPRQTALSLARRELMAEKEKDAIPKTLAYRDGQVFKPTGAKAEAGVSGPGTKLTRPISGRSSSRKMRNSESVSRTLRPSPTGKGEESMTTKTWLKMYSLTKQHLNLDRLASGSECHHIGHKSSFVQVHGHSVEAKLCQIYPTIAINGKLTHILLSAAELGEYEIQISKLLTRYLKRLQWLLAGSRRVFGSVVESKCIILIDISGSMDQSMDELKKELISLIWEQLHKRGIWFNLISFSRECTGWRDRIVDPTEENCLEAAEWVLGLRADGNTCTLQALQMAFRDEEVDSVYLLTDGKPDTSTSLVIEEVTTLNSERKVKINTISFNCSDSVANNFLKNLAVKNRGRYHKVLDNFDVQLFCHELIEGGFLDPENPPSPHLEGDDLRRLVQEINKARRFIANARLYRAVIENLKSSPTSVSASTSIPSLNST